MTASTSEEKNHWLVVGSRENFEISGARGFTLQGIKSRQRKKAELIRPGDPMIFYLTGLKVLGGIVTVTSEMFESHEFIWPCSSTGADGSPEVYPYRFKTQPLWVTLDPDRWLPVDPIHEELQYLKKWPAKNWTLGFQGNLHQWPACDYALVEKLLKERIG